MYVANHFSMSPEQVRTVLTAVEAADLITMQPGGLVATFLPFVFDPDVGEHGALITHVARNNSQAAEPVDGEALVIVHGAEHYVSPRWQPSLSESGTVVPTWNYVTVHVYGDLVVHDDPRWTGEAVRRLTAAHETSYSTDDVPADHIDRMLRAIVGLEVRLTRIEAKAKMSQNRRPEDVRGIVAGLRDEAAEEPALRTASWMEHYSVPAADRRAALLRDVAGRRGGRSAQPSIH